MASVGEIKFSAEELLIRGVEGDAQGVSSAGDGSRDLMGERQPGRSTRREPPGRRSISSAGEKEAASPARRKHTAKSSLDELLVSLGEEEYPVEARRDIRRDAITTSRPRAHPRRQPSKDAMGSLDALMNDLTTQDMPVAAKEGPSVAKARQEGKVESTVPATSTISARKPPQRPRVTT